MLTNFVGGSEGLALGLGSPAEAFARFLPQCEATFPGSAARAEERFVRMHWPSYPHAEASYIAILSMGLPLPGRPRALARPLAS